MELTTIISDFANSLKANDSLRPVEHPYQAGIGPHKEDNLRRMALSYLKGNPNTMQAYRDAGPKQYPGSRRLCDVVLPGEWAIELKLLRPFNDNGRIAEHWSNKILHPYVGNESTIGDVLKLKDSAFNERKAVILFGFEHEGPKVDTEPTLAAFELIVRNLLNVRLGNRIEETRTGLIHSVFQVLRIIAWEIEPDPAIRQEAGDYPSMAMDPAIAMDPKISPGQIGKQLYKALVESRFSFIAPGETSITAIYESVRQQFPDLCDDNYLCSDNCRTTHTQPEWKHKVRSALQSLKSDDGIISFSGRRNYWIFRAEQ